jgi:hypothetical protein
MKFSNFESVDGFLPSFAVHRSPVQTNDEGSNILAIMDDAAIFILSGVHRPDK